MKKFTQILAFLGLAALSASAQISPYIGPWYEYSSAGSTNGVNGKTAWAIISANSWNGGAPVVTYVSWGSDLASSVLTFYTTTNKTTSPVLNASGTSFFVGSNGTNGLGTNGFASGDAIVIQHRANDTYERLTLTTFTSGTNMVTTYAPSQVIGSGDIIYQMKSGAVIPLGVGTNTIAVDNIYAGQPGVPLLMDVTGTAAGAAKLNLATARFQGVPQMRIVP